MKMSTATVYTIFKKKNLSRIEWNSEKQTTHKKNLEN